MIRSDFGLRTPKFGFRPDRDYKIRFTFKKFSQKFFSKKAHSKTCDLRESNFPREFQSIMENSLSSSAPRIVEEVAVVDVLLGLVEGRNEVELVDLVESFEELGRPKS